MDIVSEQGMVVFKPAWQEHHVPKAYIYTAMLFSLGLEALNIRARGKRLAA